MKKKTKLVAICLCAGLVLTACGNRNESKHITEVVQSQSKEVQEVENEIIEKEPKEESTDKTTAESKENLQKEVNKESQEVTEDTTQSKEVYERFLAGNEPVYFDNCNVAGYDADYFEEKTPYLYNEFVEQYESAGKTIEADDEFKVLSAKYTYIDCGMDGVPELALNLTYFSYSTFPANISKQILNE